MAYTVNVATICLNYYFFIKYNFFVRLFSITAYSALRDAWGCSLSEPSLGKEFTLDMWPLPQGMETYMTLTITSPD